ncbi:uncharacterized protein J8A68_004238 [[Candida] subhashii]|uniref:Integrase catalytic domain-containing protein n=1 Tax=[Candida] subhashii TaxID=561895 RepID=A0A8J5QKQ3_9ASCO|nr:uncharacterized protein J8A68_004238 [[Candida] subhashii]KAG7662228.1 hypothetical protein J8A68_004238 [[Candida] subhashii]
MNDSSTLLVYDTAATDSVIKNSQLLSNLKPSKESLNTAIDSKFRTTKIGELKISVNNSEMNLSEVYVAPDVSFNLVSVNQLTRENDSIFLFNAEHMYTIENQELKLIAAKPSNINLYMGPVSGKLKPEREKPSNPFFKQFTYVGNIFMGQDTDDEDTIEVLDEGFEEDRTFEAEADPFGSTRRHDDETEDDEQVDLSGVPSEHISISSLPQIVADPQGVKDLYYRHISGNHMPIKNLLSGITNGKIKAIRKAGDVEQLKRCETCQVSNMKLSSHNHVPQRTVTRRLESVHSDTMGPFKTRNESKYLTTVIDFYSKFLRIITSTKKSVKQDVINILTIWNNKFPEKIVHFRSDNAPELPKQKDLFHLGIETNEIPIGTPQLNGFAESTNRKILLNIYRCLLNFKGQPCILDVFDQIIEYVVTIMNHTPRPEFSGKSPFQVFQRLPDYQFQHYQFGLDVLIKCSSKREAQKLGITPQKTFPLVVYGFFVGYGSDTGVYKIKVSTRRYPLILTSNVRFLNSMKVINHFLAGFGSLSENLFSETYEKIMATEMWQNDAHEIFNDDIPNPNNNEFQTGGDDDQTPSSDPGENITLKNQSVTNQNSDHIPRDECNATGLLTEDLSNPHQSPNNHHECNATGLLTEDLSNPHQSSNIHQESNATGLSTEDLSNPHQSSNIHQESNAIDLHTEDFSNPHLSSDNHSYATGLLNEDLSDPHNDQHQTDMSDLPDEDLSSHNNHQSEVDEASSTSDQDNSNHIPRIHEEYFPQDSNAESLPRSSWGRIRKPNPKYISTIIRSMRENPKFFKEYESKLKLRITDPLTHEDENQKDEQQMYINAVFDDLLESDPRVKEAREAELNKFKKYEVFKVVKRPENIKPMTTRWVDTYKENDLKEQKYKSRLVAHGYKQKEGKDYDPTRVSSPVIDLVSIRVLTAIATKNKLSIHHLDIQSAYLNAELTHDKPIYAQPPSGVDIPEGHCWLLQKSVYGMKQSGFEWYEKLSKVLGEIGLSRTENKGGLFVGKINGVEIIVAIYVDDLFMVAQDEDVLNTFKESLNKYFELKYFGEVSEYLGISFETHKWGRRLSQETYLRKLITSNNISNKEYRTTPLPRELEVILPNDPNAEFFEPEPKKDILNEGDKKRYQQVVGSLLWAARNTRPDIAFAVNHLGSKCSQPCKQDWEHMRWCLGYIACHLEYYLDFKIKDQHGEEKDFTIETYSDASFAPERDRRSISSYLIYMDGNLVDWSSCKQRVITTSTQACELIALGRAVNNTMDVRQISEAVGYKVRRIYVYEDNEAVIKACKKESTLHSRRTVEINLKLLQQMIREKKFELNYVTSEENLSDLLTKPIPNPKFKTLSEQINSRNQ